MNKEEQHGSEPEALPLPAKSLPSIQLWGAALHAVALLALSGFIIKIAQEQFLGISLLQWGPAELSTTAGRWLVDTVLVVCQVCIHHELWLLLWIIVVLGFVVISFEAAPASRMFHVSRGLASLITFFLLATVLLRVQLPLTTVEGWLTTSLGDRFPSHFKPPSPEAAAASATPIASGARPCTAADALHTSSTAAGSGTPCGAAHSRVPLTTNFFQEKQDYFNKTIFMAKASGVGACITPKTKGLPPWLEGLASKPDKWKQIVENAQAKLQDDYVVGVALCLGAWIVLYLQRPCTVTNRLEGATEFVLLIVSFVLLPLCTLMIPYSYGKLIGSTQFAEAAIQPAYNAPDPLPGNHFLVERSDSLTSVLQIAAGVPKISVVRTDQITELDLMGKVDVLEFWNQQYWCQFANASAVPAAGPVLGPAPGPVQGPL